MNRQLFGTDGIRGLANTHPMTADMVVRLAMATGYVLGQKQSAKTVVIGKDTRLSGYMLEPALVAGFTAVGLDVVLLGPVPTPAVAMLTRSLRADIGVMISASHNPASDNGIKIFDRHGRKLSDAVEAEIESHLVGNTDSLRVPALQLGRARRLDGMDGAVGRYIEFAKSTFPNELSLHGLKIVIDTAHGAAYKVAPPVLWELGAEVISLHCEPNGLNINDNCGALYPNTLQHAVRQHGADLGIALDGDADRVVLVNERGELVDGDSIVALLALDLQHHNKLRHATVVSTVMANFALESFLANHGITLERAAVGDRYVTEMMEAKQLSLGGEPSGHIILSAINTTGDGLIAALQVLAVMVRSQQRASAALTLFTPAPQKTLNVRVADKKILHSQSVQSAVTRASALLANRGRLVVRASGTEPLIRITAEATDSALIEQAIAIVATSLEEPAHASGG